MPYQLEITLQDVDPPIWRRVVVPADLTLADLHHVIQIVMGWSDYHLHDFTIRGRRYALPHEENYDHPANEETTRLRDVVKARSRFTYQYDFGDDWVHVIRVEKATADTTDVEPVCIDGARACPPEDSGGPFGYAEKLEAFARPRRRATAYLREWMGDFDAEAFDLAAVNKQLRDFFA
ncbi:MAG TPA: plasmid pRiA4b ORF-3 family protein [Thermoanaerobaculia bacterium]